MTGKAAQLPNASNYLTLKNLCFQGCGVCGGPSQGSSYLATAGELLTAAAAQHLSSGWTSPPLSEALPLLHWVARSLSSGTRLPLLPGEIQPRLSDARKVVPSNFAAPTLPTARASPNRLRDAHAALDFAARVAYGMKDSEDPLAFLLALNLGLADEEANGVRLTPRVCLSRRENQKSL
jgi:hypothetical protein